jgi:hypothetical protein
MIVIYNKMERKRIADEVASHALQTLQNAIERLEARGECAASERDCWEKLRTALVSSEDSTRV